MIKGLSSMETTISVIVPVYNEEQTIGEVIKRILKVSEVKQIIVIDDGSVDRTRQILLQSFSDTVEVICSEVNRGKGWAIRQALRRAFSDVIVIQDADLEYHPNDYKNLLIPIINGRAEVVYGNRLSSSHFLNHPVHFLGNKAATFLLNFLNFCYVADVACGLKMFRRSVMEAIDINSDGFEFDIEITSKIIKAGFKIHSAPVTYKPRSRQEGKKFSWADRIKTIQAIFCN